jgi:hypothetical protein
MAHLSGFGRHGEPKDKLGGKLSRPRGHNGVGLRPTCHKGVRLRPCWPQGNQVELEATTRILDRGPGGHGVPGWSTPGHKGVMVRSFGRNVARLRANHKDARVRLIGYNGPSLSPVRPPDRGLAGRQVPG